MNTASYAPVAVAEASPDVRATFIRRTYGHLAAAIGVFALLEYIFLGMPAMQSFAITMVSGKSWLLVLGAFMVVGWIADRWARSDTSPQLQYLGLGLFVVAEAIIMLPLLFLASRIAGGEVISQAAWITALLVAGLTAVVFTTKKDFSFLRGVLVIGFFVALGLIVASILIGFNLGLIFSGAMIVLASISILYTTSNILHHYRPDQHVAASLGLFASVALLFWYVLQVLLSFTGRN
ncbi:MAG TPA: Bax inhibitor-1 family protein [Verrucomicrobiales bacterium]|nr:Bax inhibitor-1 family protein [Verrucomicrobiales bacterium]